MRIPHMRINRSLIIVSVALIASVGAFATMVSPTALPLTLQQYYYSIFGQSSYREPPSSQPAALGPPEPPCPDELARPDWRKAQTIDGVRIEASPLCVPDNPHAVAAFVKGTNKVSKGTLMEAGLAPDAVVLGKDRDNDGDPDEVEVHLEVAELNGRSPDIPDPIPSFAIAPGINPGLWVFVPKIHGTSTKNILTTEANPYLRSPSPAIRVEQGDTIRVHLENTHYLPHTIHFHGVDHSFMLDMDHGNDGVSETSELPVRPGQSHFYEMTPRHTRGPCCITATCTTMSISSWACRACSWSRRTAPTTGCRP